MQFRQPKMQRMYCKIENTAVHGPHWAVAIFLLHGYMLSSCASDMCNCFPGLPWGVLQCHAVTLRIGRAVGIRPPPAYL